MFLENVLRNILRKRRREEQGTVPNSVVHTFLGECGVMRIFVGKGRFGMSCENVFEEDLERKEGQVIVPQCVVLMFLGERRAMGRLGGEGRVLDCLERVC